MPLRSRQVTKLHLALPVAKVGHYRGVSYFRNPLYKTLSNESTLALRLAPLAAQHSRKGVTKLFRNVTKLHLAPPIAKVGRICWEFRNFAGNRATISELSTALVAAVREIEGLEGELSTARLRAEEDATDGKYERDEIAARYWTACSEREAQEEELRKNERNAAQAKAIYERVLAGSYRVRRTARAGGRRRIRRSIPEGLRFKVLKRCDFRCAYCGQSASADPLQIDHIIPVAKGGRSVIENLTAACAPCNRGKRDTLLSEPSA